MPRGKNQKLKLLYLAKIMLEETDDTHALTMTQILDKLAAYDIEAQRKSVYDDIVALEDFGIEIIKEQVGKMTYYHVGSREFEIAELKLLVDAIQSSKFITTKKTSELIGKLARQASIYDGKILKREVYVTGRIKNMNESIYYIVDEIHNALNSNSQITFRYYSWNVDGKAELRHHGKLYTVSPWMLLWDDENYYLIAYDEDSRMIRHYRVDKMMDIQSITRHRTGEEAFLQRNMASYSRTRFGMFDGREVKPHRRHDASDRAFWLCRKHPASHLRLDPDTENERPGYARLYPFEPRGLFGGALCRPLRFGLLSVAGGACNVRF